ncbi:aldo/keto reductase [Microbacterium cremeum]|uniref:aldo/keto reductase n=1 Tax=Microbacterium cremeum TaxID=2782169 RepID=UPI001886B170|nr:aldo/keto reductase [Microbacterium cremeum]
MALRETIRPLTPEGAHPSLGLGCAPIGNLYAPVSERAAEATVEEAYGRGIRFFDTAPHYGAGVSEVRLGRALAGVDRDTVSIATKIGRRIVDTDGRTVPAGGTGADTVGDLSRDGVLRSLEGSLRRLDTDRVDLLYLHDPADVDEALAGALPALIELRDEGVVRAVGVGMVHTKPLHRYVCEAPIDVVMPAGRLTLLDRSARGALVPAARQRGVGLVAAGVYNSGILVDPRGAPYFDYRPAEPAVVARALELEAACERHGVRLSDAATRWPLREPAVDAVVIGARTEAEVAAFHDGFDTPIPDALWHELEPLGLL